MSHNPQSPPPPIGSNNHQPTTNQDQHQPGSNNHHNHQNQLGQRINYQRQIPLHLINNPPRHPIIRSISSFLDRLSVLSPARAIDAYFNRSNPPSDITRNIHVGLRLPEDAFEIRKNSRLKIFKKSNQSHKKIKPEWVFPNNQIRTAKYSLLSFIPKNLFEQFRRVANVFFLVLVILQFLPKFSQTSPFLSALPLLFVLAITACKDGYEDIRRHQADRNTNAQSVLALDPSIYSNPHHARPFRNLSVPKFGKSKPSNSPSDASSSPRANQTPPSPSTLTVPQQSPSSEMLQLSSAKRPWCAHYRTVSRTSTSIALQRPSPRLKDNVSDKDAPRVDGEDELFTPTTWDSLRVGDYVKVLNNQAVPADILICSSSDPEENVCFIETKNLDGETNLKSRHGLSQLNFIRSSRDCTEQRKDHMNQFVVECEAPDPDLYSFRAAIKFPKVKVKETSDEPLRVPVDLNSILLRGTVVRNTEWVIGVVIMTGVDTKIMLNSSGTPSKRSKVERQMNPMVTINLFILACMCIFNAIGTHFFERYHYDRNSYWSYGSDRSDDNPEINGAIGFVFAMITYQNIVPISLYISIEFVRTVQAYLIWADDQLEANGLRTLARSWNLSDDLGQIQYVFSDKTGTLTQNLMQFRQCSIGGKVYRGTVTQSTQGAGISDVSLPRNQSNPQVEPLEKSKDEESPEVASSKSTTRVNRESVAFEDSELSEDLKNHHSDQSRLIHGFFATLALCHTVLASEDENGVLVYKAQSPDEAALVQTAADVGFVFRGRDKNVIRLEVPKSLEHGQDSHLNLSRMSSRRNSKVSDDCRISSTLDNESEVGERNAGDELSEINEYELLEVVEFTSARKRMSVVLRRIEPGEHPGSISESLNNPERSEDLYLLVKGADNVIFERLESGQDSIKATTDQQLEDFANQGLRTLCLAYRKLDRNEFNSWQQRYQQACSSLTSDRDKKILKVQDELERDLILLGATAIEDKLQDGVPESIKELKEAGIKVWVATGDKLETAVAIGRTCNLISPDMNLIIVRGGAYGTKASAYDQIRKALVEFFDGGDLVNELKELPPDHLERLKSERLARNLSSHTQDDLHSIVGENNGNRSGGYGLVIDGASLKHSIGESFTKEALLELSTRCLSVICCRTSPKQKSEIVRMVKDCFKNKGVQTLAIGDGANDVSMIQTADIGIGVQGEEGLQAVNSSDYAIAQFRFLNRLLFVHGHWSYVRNSKLINNFFYKEIIGIAVLWLYQFWCGYSTTTLYEYTYLLFYNVFWSFLPVIGIGIFEQDIREKVLTQVPELYSVGRESRLFTIWQFGLYMTEGIYQGFVIYLLIAFSYMTTSPRTDGYDVGMFEFSTVIIVAVVLTLNIFNGFDQAIWNYGLLFAVFLGPVLIVIYTAVYSAISPGWLWTVVYGNNHYLWRAAYWWFGNMISIVASILPRLVYKYIQEIYYPSDVQILRYHDKYNPEHDYSKDDRVRYNRSGTTTEVKGETTKENEKLGESPIGIMEGTPRASGQDDGRNQQVAEGHLNVLENVNSHELIRSRTSLTHDMATGQLSPSSGRGFNFDQADGVGEFAVGNRLRRYNTSVLSIGQIAEEREGVIGGGERVTKVMTTPGVPMTPSRRSRLLRDRPLSIRLGNLQRAFGSIGSSALRPGHGSSAAVGRNRNNNTTTNNNNNNNNEEVDVVGSGPVGNGNGSDENWNHQGNQGSGGLARRISGFLRSQNNNTNNSNNNGGNQDRVVGSGNVGNLGNLRRSYEREE